MLPANEVDLVRRLNPRGWRALGSERPRHTGRVESRGKQAGVLQTPWAKGGADAGPLLPYPALGEDRVHVGRQVRLCLPFWHGLKVVANGRGQRRHDVLR